MIDQVDTTRQRRFGTAGRRVAGFTWTYGPSIALVIFAIGLWELLVRILDVPGYLWPAPSAIARTLGEEDDCDQRDEEDGREHA